MSTNSTPIRRVARNSRHIRYNVERSPDSLENTQEGNKLLRYHILVVSDKNRKQTTNRVMEYIARITPGIEIIRDGLEGSVKDSKLKYRLTSFDTPTSPEKVEWENLGLPVKRDRGLYERQRGLPLEDRVAEYFN